MKTVFLCHSSKDKVFTRRLARDLDRHGIRPWVDEAEIRVGESLLRSVEEGLRLADYVAVVLSRNAVRRPWVRAELEAALTLELARRRRVVLPILHERCPVPLFLRNKKYADFTVSYRLGLEELVEAVEPSRDGLQRRLTNVHGGAELVLLRRDGSLARITKEVTLKCREGHVDSFIDTLSGDSRRTSIRVSPGRIADSWREGGKTYFRSVIEPPISTGSSITRHVSFLLRDAFLERDEAFDLMVHYPTKCFVAKVRFPKSRPPSTWRAHERRGPDLIEIPSAVSLGSNRGWPELRLVLNGPRLNSSYVIRWSW